MSNDSNDDVTRHMPNHGDDVTRRMRSDVTRAMSDGGAAPFPAVLAPGDRVNARYRVVAGPLGEPTGEAEIYRCEDTATGESVALKLYLAAMQPKQQVLEQLQGLSHADIVKLHGWGSHAGRFFEIMEFCEGGTLADIGAPIGETEIEDFIIQALSGLEFLHASGIIHRDLKPGNLMFRDAQRRDLVVADFGISSWFENGGKSSHKTATWRRLTLEFAAPECFHSDEVSEKADYYSLGVTLLYARKGGTPYVHVDGRPMEKDAKLVLKGQGSLHALETESDRLRFLIRGLTRIASSRRWGSRQVRAWLAGREVKLDDDTLDLPDVEDVGRSHYPDHPDIRNPRQLAAALDRLNAAQELFRSRISGWLFTNFGHKLADKVADIEENMSKQPELAVFKLRYTLDPTQPLEMAGARITTLAALADELEETFRTSSEAALDTLVSMLRDTRLDCWIEATQAENSAREALEALAAARRRLTEPNARCLFAFFRALRPEAPLHLTPEAALAAPGELEGVLTSNAGAEAGLELCLYDGRLEEWLRSFPDEGRLRERIADVANRHERAHDLGVACVRWAFGPDTVPFAFGQTTVRDPAELASLITTTSENFQLGISLLASGWLRGWLVSSGLLCDVEQFDRCVERNDWSEGAKLQYVLPILSKNAARPKPAARPAHVDLGVIPVSDFRQVKLEFYNAGPGHLTGTLSLAQSADAGGQLTATTLDGSPLQTVLTIAPGRLPAGSHQTMTVRLDGNGGRLDVPVSFIVGAPWRLMLLNSARSGLVVGSVLGVVRLILQQVQPSWDTGIIGWTQWTDLLPRGMPEPKQFAVDGTLLSCLLLGVGVLGATCAGLYHLSRQAELRRAYHRED